MTKRQISFDTETTGIDPRSGHRVVEIGCVEMIDYLRTGNTFHTYVNPLRDMPPEAEKVHGLSESFLADKPVFTDIAQEFMAFVGTSPLVAHNASFDMRFINWELKEAGLPIIPMSQSIDTVEMARRMFPGQPASLDALCRRFGVDLSVRTKHGALLDAELLADVYLELKGGRQVDLGLKEDSCEKGESASSYNSVHSFPVRHYTPTDAEVSQHRAFLEKHMKDTLWQKYKAADTTL